MASAGDMASTGEQLKYGFLNNYETLVRRLSVSSILGNLYSEGFINSSEKEAIQSQLGENSKASFLLDVIFRQGQGDPEIFRNFFTLLSENSEGQNLETLWEKVKEDSKSEEVHQKFQYQKKGLEEGDRLALEKNKKVIIETLSVHNVLPALMTCGAVTSGNKGNIL